MRIFLLLLGLLLIMGSSSQTAEASRCGLQGSDNALPGTDLTGYWQGTLGLMRLVRTTPGMVEGPASGTEYLHGSFSNNLWQGQAAMDVGRKYRGTFVIRMTEGGRCLKGSIDWGDGTDEVLGQRVAKPSSPYTIYYILDQNTEALKQMVGGTLNLRQVDGPNNQIPPHISTPALLPALLPDLSNQEDEADIEQDFEGEEP